VFDKFAVKIFLLIYKWGFLHIKIEEVVRDKA